MRNTRRGPAALRLSLLLAVALLAVSSSALLAQTPQAAAPLKAAVQAPVTLADIFAPAPTEAAAKPTPSQGVARGSNYVIQNEKSLGIPGTRRSFSHSLTGDATSDICASGSCDCNSCSCYGTYDCCAAGCGACFAVACGLII